MMEFIIWGLSPRNLEHEEPLYTLCRNQGEADAMMGVLRVHGCTEMRVQILDLSANPSEMWKASNLLNNKQDER